MLRRLFFRKPAAVGCIYAMHTMWPKKANRRRQSESTDDYFNFYKLVNLLAVNVTMQFNKSRW